MSLAPLIVAVAAVGFARRSLRRRPTIRLRRPIPATEGVIKVNFVEFASLPDLGEPMPARMMLLVDEPGTQRLFVNDMRGPLYSVSHDGKAVTLYLDINAPNWGVQRQFDGQRARIPELRLPSAVQPARHARFRQVLHLHRYRQYVGRGRLQARRRNAYARHGAAGMDGQEPGRRDLRRRRAARVDAVRAALRQPQRRPARLQSACLAGQCRISGCSTWALPTAAAAAIRSTSRRTSPRRSARCSASTRSAPTARTASTASRRTIRTSATTIPPRSAKSTRPGCAIRSASRGTRRNGNLFVADIGQNIVEEVSLITKGANLGWNDWEGSFRFISREAREPRRPAQRSEDGRIPIVEYGQPDPLLQPQSAVTMGSVYRQKTIPQLANLLVFGDNPSGEVFYINADKLPSGGQDRDPQNPVQRERHTKTLLQSGQGKERRAGQAGSTRADLRFGEGPNGEIFLLTKRDGVDPDVGALTAVVSR